MPRAIPVGRVEGEEVQEMMPSSLVSRDLVDESHMRASIGGLLRRILFDDIQALSGLEPLMICDLQL